MDGFQKFILLGFRLPRSLSRISTEFNDHPTPNVWKWYWFGCGLTFTHFYLVASNLLPNFLIIITHSIFNIMLSGIPLNKNGTCIEDFVLVNYNIMKY